jgi:hypothetical protein
MHARATATAGERALLREATTPNVCPFACQAKVPQHRGAIGADRFAALFLSLARFVGAAYATGDADCWEAAHQCAENVVGPIDGPLFVARAAALVRAIRRDRDHDLAYWPASCNRLSDDEAKLMLLIESARKADLIALERAAADVLGKRRGARAIREAAGQFADLCRTPAAPPTPLYGELRPSRGACVQEKRGPAAPSSVLRRSAASRHAARP